MSAESVNKFKAGSEVQLVSDSTRIGVVVEPDCLHGGVWFYLVNFGGDRKVVPETDLIPYLPQQRPFDILKAGKLGNHDEFLRNILYQKLSKANVLTNNIYAFNVSRTIFYPYQFKPLLKFIESSNNRILIADEVGLGKTIEAGLIYMELKARQKLSRVLVICPSSLKEKWKYELERRFGEEFQLLNSADFARFIDKYQEFHTTATLKGIISLESIRQESILDRLEEVGPDFDLIIVDEAHHMRNSLTKQHRVGKLLSDGADALIMLSATPIQLGNEDLFRLLNILDEDNFPNYPLVEELFRKNEPVVKAQTCIGRIPADISTALSCIKQTEQYLKRIDKPYLLSLCQDALDRMNALKTMADNGPDYRNNIIELQREVAELNILSHIFNRTRKREAKEKIVLRRSFPIKIELTPIEREFYDAVLHFVKTEAKKKTKSPFVQQWLICTPLRRISSCMTAMVEYYKNNLSLDADDQGDDEEFSESETTDNVKRRDEFSEARGRLKAIIDRMADIKDDSKFLQFKKVIDSIREKEGKAKVMVFAFFKDTLKYLQKRLREEGISIMLITGDTKHNERPALIEKFRNDSSIEVLLSSRVGSEGLDFQFCDTIVNYDLPWNPMEVEQRIGRLDRIGQLSPVIRIYNFYIENTIEERILNRLYERIGIFEKSIGELEPIIGAEIRDLISELISKDLSPLEESERIERSARIIENKRQELENLEKKSAQFIGVDSYFDEEIDRIRRTKRYITSEQLACFIFDFLKSFCPNTRFEYDSTTKKGKIYTDSKLQRIISETGKSSELSRFFGAEQVDFTFDSDFAFQNQHFEFLNNSHALTNVIMEYYKKAELKFNNAYHIVLKTDKAKPGIYFYFVFRLKISAARPRNTLEAIFIDKDLKDIYSGEEAEILVGEMIENGKNAEVSTFDIEENFISSMYQQAKTIFMQRLNSMRDEVTRNNNLLVEGRVASLKMTYNKKIQQKQKQLAKGEREKKDQRYLNMLTAQIKRWTNELQTAVEKEAEKKIVSVEYDEIAAGILEVS